MDVTLLEELKDKSTTTPIRPDRFGITQREYAESNNCTVPQSAYYLESLVRLGVLESHILHSTGKTGIEKVYHRPGEYPPKE